MIGIDLGTTYCCFGHWKNNKVEIITNHLGKRTTPSIVIFTENRPLVGEYSEGYTVQYSDSTVYDLKRFIGRQYEDSIIQEDKQFLTDKIEENEKGIPIISVKYKEEKKKFRIEEIIGLLLKKIKESCEIFLKKQIEKVIITVPAHFNIIQRQATSDAGRIAGLNVLRLINEPTAASMAYKLDNKFKDKRNVLIFDLGGGTFDVSIVYFDNDVIEVKSSYGDPHLGGEDFDYSLMNYCKEYISDDISNNNKAKRRLKNKCEQVKKDLSNLIETNFDIVNFINDEDFYLQISREDFNDICKKLYERCFICVDKALEYAKMKKEDIDDIVLVGSSTRIPKMKELLYEHMNFKPKLEKNGLNVKINPEEAVAIGATYQITSVENKLSYDENKIIINDIISLPIGIEVNNGNFEIIFNRGIHIPNKVIKKLNLEKNKNIIIEVLQEEMTSEKKYSQVGLYKLFNKSKQKINFEVTFEIDVNSILSVNVNNTEIKLEKEEMTYLNEDTIKQLKINVEELEKDIKNYDKIVKIKNYLIQKLDVTKPKDKKIIDWIKSNDKKFFTETGFKKEINEMIKLNDISLDFE